MDMQIPNIDKLQLRCPGLRCIELGSQRDIVPELFIRSTLSLYLFWFFLFCCCQVNYYYFIFPINSLSENSSFPKSGFLHRFHTSWGSTCPTPASMIVPLTPLEAIARGCRSRYRDVTLNFCNYSLTRGQLNHEKAGLGDFPLNGNRQRPPVHQPGSKRRTQVIFSFLKKLFLGKKTHS